MYHCNSLCIRTNMFTIKENNELSKAMNCYSIAPILTSPSALQMLAN